MGLWNNAQWVRKEIISNKDSAQEKQKANYDKSVRHNRIFEVNDLVKIKNFKRTANACAAFEQKFVGPFKIVQKFNEVSYEISAPNVKNQVVHYNRLLPFYARDVTDAPGLLDVDEVFNETARGSIEKVCSNN